jgi:sortase A
MPTETRQRRRLRTAETRRRRRRFAIGIAIVVVVMAEAIGVLLTPRPAEGGPTAGPEAAFSSRPLEARSPDATGTVVTVPIQPAPAAARVAPIAPPPPPSPVPPLPVPAPLPDPLARVALVEIGSIRIPKIGLDQPVREGIEQMVIDAGPAHWPGTAAFGSWGNTVLAGHRTTHSAPFRRVGELVAGDQIMLSDTTGTYTYRVTGIDVVPRTDFSIVDQSPGRNLTIFTCHPLGSSAERLVVHAELVSSPRPGQ